MLRKPVLVAFCAYFALSGAQAALLTNVQGAVTVNRGDGYAPAGTGGAVGAGVRVHAGEGSADIVYENGCKVKVDSGETVVVLSGPPACSGVTQTSASWTYAAGALAVGGGVAALVISQGNKPASP